MTELRPPMTPLQAKLLEVITASGDKWVTRKQIAAALGRKRLRPYDIDQLEMLTHAGYIDAEKVTTGIVAFEFRYRAVKD